jgi:hypothetical protein
MFDDVPQVLSLSGRFDFSKQPKTRFSEQQMKDLEEKGCVVRPCRAGGA